MAKSNLNRSRARDGKKHVPRRLINPLDVMRGQKKLDMLDVSEGLFPLWMAIDRMLENRHADEYAIEVITVGIASAMSLANYTKSAWMSKTAHDAAVAWQEATDLMKSEGVNGIIETTPRLLRLILSVARSLRADLRHVPMYVWYAYEKNAQEGWDGVYETRREPKPDPSCILS